MPRYVTTVVTGAGQVLNRKGKLIHAQIAVVGDRIFELRDNDAGGNIIAKIDCAGEGSRELHTQFGTNLHITIASGTTGEINVTYE